MREKLLALRPLLRSPALWVGVLGTGCFLWAYWSTFASLAESWTNSPQYSHGFLVPAFALAVLWFRRKQLEGAVLAPSAWGIPLLVAGGALRLAGAYWYYPTFDALSILPSLAGLCVLLGGWAALRWAWPALGFLLFMLPLPFFVEGALAQPLQRLATAASTYVLETLGFPAVAEGNIILLNGSSIGVAEACNGLGMLVLFFAISAALAFVVRRPWWEKGLILVSAVPVALMANVARISTTGILSETVGPTFAHAVFHDWGGWLMMPLALLLLGLELRLVSWLVVVPAEAPRQAVPGIGKPRPSQVLPARGKRRGRQRPQAKVSARSKA